MKTFKMVLIFLILFSAQTSLSSPQDQLMQMKSIYQYDSWPGTSEDLIKAPSLDAMIFSGMVFIDKTESTYGELYRWGEAAGKPIIKISVNTCGTIDEAHVELLKILSGFTMTLTNGGRENLGIGDISFINKEQEQINFMAFVRNNIVISINNINNTNENNITVAEIASIIDQLLIEK